MEKLNVGILCGGKSAEHEVSLQSALNIFDAIDREKFNPVLIGISKNGTWVTGSPGCLGTRNLILKDKDPSAICLNPETRQVFLPPKSGGTLYFFPEEQCPENPVKNIPDKGLFSVQFDVLFPILHGPFGEDGTVQGLLKLAEVPFVGPGVLGSAAGMDKDVMKRLLRDAGIPIGKFLVLREGQAIPEFSSVTGQLGNPVFVKPANMGSSVGVSKVRNEAEYRSAVESAFCFDTKLVLEENIPGREIECSVMGNEEIKASLPGEVRLACDFYSYEAKYIDSDGAVTEIPAKLPQNKIEEIQTLAQRTFRVLECQGLSRIDFFLKADGAVIVNEINTMPGFTKISMFPKLWEAGGISYTELITGLINLALDRYKKESRLKTSYVNLH